MRRSFIALLLLCVLLSSLPSSHTTHAQVNRRNALVTLAPISGAGKVEMVAQTLDAELVESGENTLVNGTLVFKLHNTDRLTRADLVVGLPTWGGGAHEWNDKNFSQLVIALNGKPVQAEWQTQPLKLGNETRNVRWLAWPLSLAGDERATIQVTYKHDLGADALPSIVFAQAPAILWKGFVGSARYSVRFPALTTPEQFRSVSPADSSFDGRTVTWLFAEFNPEAPIALQFIKPRLWREITQARAALAQNSDPAAALTLGAHFATLARASQSESDWSQAVAAYQRATELASASSAAPRALANLYEARLRGEFGAVGDENATRAAALEQWQRVRALDANNAEAREAVAQHAFALAQNARRQQQYNGALALLEAARNANAARPTRAQIESEERAAQAGLVLQYSDAGQWPDALKIIEAGAAGAELQRERAAAPLFTSARATLVVESGQQTLRAELVPFLKSSAQHQQALNLWLNRVRAADPLAALALEPDSPESASYVLTVRVAAQPLRADAPTQAELSMLNELLAPAELHIMHRDGTIFGEDEFVARYALSGSQQLAQSRVDELSRMLAALREPASDETQELVRRARVRALEQYRSGWQNWLSSSAARVEWRPADGASESWELRLGESRVLQAQRGGLPLWPIAVGATCAILLLGVGVFALVRWRRAPRGA